MQFIEISYILASVIAVIAMAPQIKQVLITKESDELSLFTWVAWATYQFIALVYSVTLQIIPYILVNLVWVMFYTLMVILIIRYRKKTPVLVVQQIEAAQEPLTKLKLQNEH